MVRSVAVLGAGGATARPLIAALEARGAAVRAVVHRAERLGDFADARVADLNDADQVARAIEGAGAVHLIPPVFDDREDVFARNAVAAAQRVGIARLIYHSVLHAPTPAMPHHWRKAQVEQVVRDSPLAWTIVQPAMYMQTGFTFLDRAAGSYDCPFDPDRGFNPIDVRDLAEAVATVLVEAGHEYATYELAGQERVSARGMADAIGAAIGTALTVRRVDPDHFATARAILRGLDVRQTRELVAMYHHYDAHGLVGNGNVLAMLLKRAPARFADVARRDLKEQAA